MKLGLIYRSVIEEKEDGYYIKDVMGNYLEKIASSFSHIDVCAPVYPECLPEKSFAHYKLQLPNIKFLDIGLPRKEFSILSKLTYSIKLFKLFHAQVRNWDLLYIFLPGYSGLIASVTARLFNKPYFVYIGTNWRDSSTYVWRWPGKKKNILFPIYVFLNGYFEKIVIRNSAFTLVHGNALQNKYRIFGTKIDQTTPLINISKEDIYVKRTFADNDTVKCLTVSALIPIKGLTYLVKALSILKDRGYKITLDLVGSGDESYERKLRELANMLNLNERVTVKGYVPNGPRLLQIYRNSDIFVLPTLSEGFPRVLYEAMSQSIPIVTTYVGGIPGLMKHKVNALLVPPKNPEALAHAIERLITSRNLRERLIENGIKIIREILKKNAEEQLESLLIKFIPSYKEWIERTKDCSF